MNHKFGMPLLKIDLTNLHCLLFPMFLKTARNPALSSCVVFPEKVPQSKRSGVPKLRLKSPKTRRSKNEKGN